MLSLVRLVQDIKVNLRYYHEKKIGYKLFK